jgi:hypothetical protein
MGKVPIWKFLDLTHGNLGDLTMKYLLQRKKFEEKWERREDTQVGYGDQI